VAALCALAIGFRAVSGARTAVMFNDGPEFLAMAEAMARGDFGVALGDAYHPLYSLLTVIAYWLTGGGAPDRLATCAVAVSVLSGGVAVACLYAFLRDAFGFRAAWLGALALALHPYATRYASDVQSDGPYLALFLAAVALLWLALRRCSLALAGWAGAFSGLAYLTRPEGFGVALLGAAAGVVLALRAAVRGGRPAAWLVLALAVLAGAALTMSPYLVVLRADTGGWTLSKKKSVAELATGEEEDDAPRAEHAAARPPAPNAPSPTPSVRAPVELPAGFGRSLGVAAYDLFRTLLGALRPEIAVFLAFGLWLRRGRPGPVGWFALAFVGLYGALLLLLAFHSGYVSKRHVLPPATLAFGWVGLGIPAFGAVVLRALGRLRPRLDATGPRAAVALGAGTLVAFAVAKELRPHRAEGLAERRAAEWLRARPDAGGVAVDKRRVAWYARRAYVSLRVAPDAGIADYLRATGARWVIADEEAIEERPALGEALSRELVEIHRAEAGHDVARVFALEDGAAGTAPVASGAPARDGAGKEH